MKTKTLLLITFFGLLTSLELKAQQCGTPQTTNFPSTQRTIVKQNFLNNNESICFNVFYHIVRQNNGSGGINASLLDNITEKLNLAFNPHSLYVKNLGFDYINNTTYYNIDDSGGNNSEFNALVQINNKPNAINIYIVNNAVSYAGRANGILSQALVIESSWANTQVMSHEVGHCLDLWHTFQGTATNTSGCAEAIDGSNCTTCGDYVCDTPADANTGNSDGYSPNMDNIMSYYYPFDEFSKGQTDRVRNAFATSSMLQQIVSNSCVTICNEKPQITIELEPIGTNYVAVHMVGSKGTDINSQCITSTTWQKISSSGGCYASFGGSDFDGLGHGNCNSWSVYAKITATNSNGTTTIYRTITPPAPDPCRNSYRIGKTSNYHDYRIVINPCRNSRAFSLSNNLNSRSIENQEVRVYNHYGDLVFITNEIEFDLSFLRKGIYFIKASVNKEIITHKIIR